MLLEIFNYDFMVNGFILAFALSMLFSLSGIFIVSKDMTFFSDVISHSSMLGIGLAIILDLNLSYFLIIYTLLLALGTSFIWNNVSLLDKNSVMASLLHGLFALGIVIISYYEINSALVFQFLFGDILLITNTDIFLSYATLIIFIIFLKFHFKKLMKLSISKEISVTDGVNPKKEEYFLTLMIALIIGVSIKSVGILVVNAMIILPAVTSLLIASNYRQFLFITPILTFISFFGGLYFSYFIDTPSGPTIASVSFALFVFVIMFFRRK